MKRRLLFLSTFLIVFLLISSLSYQSKPMMRLELKKIDPELMRIKSLKSQEKVKVIVWLNDKKSTDSFKNIGRVKYQYNIIPAVAMEVPVKELENLAIESNVEKIVPDRIVSAFRLESIPLIKANNASSTFNVNGTGINISIIDTGIFNHTEFQSPNRIIKQKCYCSGCCPPDNADESDNATDDNGHGTHCAGIAAGEGNGNGQGVATNSSLFAVKVLPSSGTGGLESDLLSGIEWAVENGAKVISLSLGITHDQFNDCYEVSVSDAVDNATKQGVVVVVSAGNSGPSSQTIGAPSCAKRAITVGRTNDDDNIVSSSSRGPTKDNRTKPDLTAPGSSIYSTYNDGGYATLSGTSMSCPHVTGVAALVIQKFNQINGYYPDPDRVKTILITAVNTTGMSSSYEQRNNDYGSGRIDAYEALRIINFTKNDTISTGEEHRYKINVTSADFKTTLYWPEDKDTNNDLDLIVGNRSHNFSYQTDVNDSVEQVFLDVNTGFWNVFVEGIDASDQEYFLASNMNITDDAIPPVLVLEKPENTTYNYNESLPLNFTTDPTNQTIWYMLDGGNEVNITGNTTFNVSEGSHKLTLFVNDSYDNINQSTQYFLVDKTKPEWSLNSTSSSVAGVLVEFRLNWTDNLVLSGYTFSFDNCTGSLVNDTWQSFSGTWSNVTKTVNSTTGCTIRWKVYANDTSNNWNASGIFIFETTGDVLSPEWSGNLTYPTSPATTDQNYQFNITWTDDGAIDEALIEHNLTGSTHNNSFNGSENGEYYFNISGLTVGTYVWRSYANDTYGNENSTDQWTYVVSTTTTTTSSSTTTVPSGGGNGDTGVTREETTTSTVETTTSTTILPEKRTHSLVQEPVEDKEIEELIEQNEELIDKLSPLIGEELSEEIKNRIIELAKKIQKHVEFNRTLEVDPDRNRSSLILRVKYNATREVKDFMVYDVIPKSFANSSDSVEVSVDAEIVILKEDPEYLLVFENLNSSEEKTITYSVDRRVDEDIINEVSTPMVFALYTEAPRPTGPFYIYNTIFVVIAVFIILLFVARKVMSMRREAEVEKLKRKWDKRQEEISFV